MKQSCEHCGLNCNWEGVIRKSDVHAEIDPYDLSVIGLVAWNGKTNERILGSAELALIEDVLQEQVITESTDVDYYDPA